MFMNQHTGNFIVLPEPPRPLPTKPRSAQEAWAAWRAWLVWKAWNARQRRQIEELAIPEPIFIKNIIDLRTRLEEIIRLKPKLPSEAAKARRRVREIVVESAKLEQLRLERRFAEATARIESVIRSHTGGGAAGSGFTNSDSVAAYLEEAAAAPLLSREDEIAIAKRIEAGGDDGDRAKGEMARANLRLVISISKKHAHRLAPRSKYSLQFLDLIQEGNIGLMTAVGEFDWRLGNRFSTFATWSIMDAITRPLKKREVQFSFKNVDELASDPETGCVEIVAKKKSVPGSDDLKNDQVFTNSASYSRARGALIEARKRTRATSESVFSRGGFGYGLSQERDYGGAADHIESEESKQMRQEKADGTYDDPLAGMEEL
jgi:RNA polymerase sigma factor (sigma-70 family)